MKQPKQEDVEEIWESQIPGRTFVETRDVDGRPRSNSANGVGSRVRLQTSDRVRMQERIRTKELDPFRNGCLVRVDADQQEDADTQSADALTESDLKACFDLELDDFRSYVAELGEVNIRRLKKMGPEASATINQAAFLDELIEQRYAIGRDTPTWREMNTGPNTPS